jgi:hypothetical protein
MKHLSFLLFCMVFPRLILAQDEQAQVIAAIHHLFNGMRAADSNQVKAAFHPDARLQTATVDAEGKPRLATTPIARFASRVGTAKPGSLDERIWSYDVRIDQGLASVWTEYTFIANGQFSHCGVNTFHLMKTAEGWKITQVTDTRRKEKCIMEEPKPQQEAAAVIDAWHRAAAIADEDKYFGAMSTDAVFLGTDAKERWLRDDMKKAMEKAFAGKSAWDFKPRERHILLSANGQFAYWDELLDTWMGVCRGSGVLEKQNGAWVVKHYNLAVTLPNELMKKYQKLTKK